MPLSFIHEILFGYNANLLLKDMEIGFEITIE